MSEEAQTLQELKSNLEELGHLIYCAERSNNTYATSGLMDAHSRERRSLEQAIKLLTLES